MFFIFATGEAKPENNVSTFGEEGRPRQSVALPPLDTSHLSPVDPTVPSLPGSEVDPPTIKRNKPVSDKGDN